MALWGSREELVQYLEEARCRADRAAVKIWRTVISRRGAEHRAARGDRAAARRLEWIKLVDKRKDRARYLMRRVGALEGEIQRIIHRGPPCAAGAGTLEKRRRSLDEILAEIANLPRTVTTYREYVRQMETEADAWLRRQLEGLGERGGL